MTLAGRDVLVTGAAGFLGSHLVASLVADGARVRALDDGSRGDPATLDPVRGEIEWVAGDLLRPELLAPLAAGCEVIFHLAARPDAEAATAHAVNAEGALAVLEAARAGEAGRVVLASSWRVYGRGDPAPLSEAGEPQPDDLYGLQCRCAERYAGLYARLHGLATVALRYFPVFGPGQPEAEGPAGELLAEARIRAQGGPARPAFAAEAGDLLFVDDAVRATRLAAETDLGVGAVVNVTRGLDRADPSRAKRQLGFEPAVTMAEGLARTVAWLEQEGKNAR